MKSRIVGTVVLCRGRPVIDLYRDAFAHSHYQCSLILPGRLCFRNTSSAQARLEYFELVTPSGAMSVTASGRALSASEPSFAFSRRSRTRQLINDSLV